MATHTPHRESPWRDPFGRAASRAAQVLLLAALFALLGLLFFRLQMVVVAVLVALILACAVFPLVRRLSDLGWPRVLATLTTFVGILVVLAAFIAAVVWAVADQWDSLMAAAQQGWQTLQDASARLPFAVDGAAVQEIWSRVQGVASGGAVEQSALTGLTTAGEVVTGTVLMVIVLFFFLQDAERIWGFLLSWFPPHHTEKLRRTGRDTVRILGGYVRGTAAVAVIEMLAIVVVLWLLGVPLAIPLAMLMFLGAFIPIVGPIVAGALAALVALVTTGPWAALVVVIAVFVIHHLETGLLRPFVMGRTVRLPALVVLLSIALGTLVDGVVGAALAVPLTAVAWSVIQLWLPRPGRIGDPAHGL